MILALCAIIFAAVLWLTRGKTPSPTLPTPVQPVPTLSRDAGTNDMLLELQKTQDDAGAADLDQLQKDSLEL